MTQPINFETDQFWFYNGFNEPKALGTVQDLDGVFLFNNYLGDITDDFKLELHRILKLTNPNQQSDALDDLISTYDIFRNPSFADFSARNIESYGLSPNAYLESWL